MMENYVQIGKIVATHGTGGEIIILHSLGKKNAFKNLKAFFIEEKKESYIPYFLEKSTAKTDEEAIIKLEDIDNKEQARRFIKKNIWLTENDFDKTADKNAAISLLNYSVFNNDEKLGMVEEIIEQPHQLLLKITYKTKEALIPLHEETVLSIDKKKKEIHVDLPDGLLEIYLEN